MPETKHWLRNIPQHPAFYWLPVAGGKTYPDFVAELNDGRLLVVEYKGDHLKEKDAHKDVIGQLWEREMKGEACISWPSKRMIQEGQPAIQLTFQVHFRGYPDGVPDGSRYQQYGFSE